MAGQAARGSCRSGLECRDRGRFRRGRVARRRWGQPLPCGSGQRAAVLYTLIQTARLNDVDPQAWLADVLARIADHPVQRLDDLLPWNWRKGDDVLSQAA